MSAQTETALLLTCPQGHSWQLPSDDTLAATTTQRCPVCGEQASTVPTDIRHKSASQSSDVRPEIPGYELLEELGRGGMAVVFKAQQKLPKRIVALKILHHPAVGDSALVARFRSEAQAVAVLEHPHIVRIYEVGEADRLSYLALEYIAGGTLSQRLKGEPQDARQTAELVAKLARAMHYAHQRGIVHRDLKPANILLSERDESAASGDDTSLSDVQPHIADFGLAKRLEDDSQQTRTGDILGTPMYMAPEQATGVTRNIGPACDIHALGVILYEMLTGHQPFRGADVMETVRLVASADPVPPRRLNAQLPRDLETICLKCLEKLPKQRYASAAELADELQRYLSGETIHTRPAGPLEKSYKWSLRNPAKALALAVALLAPLLIVAGLIIHNGRITKELANTAQQRNRAEENLQQTQDAVDKLLAEIADGRLARLPHSEPVRRQMLEWAMGLCQDLRVENPDNTRLQMQSARAQRQTADIQRLLGRFAEADKNYEQSIEQLAKPSLTWSGDLRPIRELAAAYNNRGLLKDQLGRTTEAERDYRQALEYGELVAASYQESAEYHQSRAASLSNLGLLLQRLGQTKLAEEQLQQALDLRKTLAAEQSNHQGERRSIALAASRINLGGLYLADGRFEPAQREFESARNELLEVQELDRASAELREALAAAENNLAAVLIAQQQNSLAQEANNRAVDLFAQLVEEFPAALGYREQLASARLNLALLLAAGKKTDDAEPLIEQSLATFEQLADEQPDVPQYRQGMTKALQQLARHQAQSGEQRQAELTLRQAIHMQTSLTERFPGRADVFSQLGLLQHAAAELLAARNDNADARHYFELAAQSQRTALAPNAEALAYRLRLRDHLQALAKLLIEQGEPSASALAIDELATLFPAEADSQIQAAQLLAQCLPLAAVVKGQEKIQGQTAEAYCRQRCLELLRQAVRNGYRDVDALEQIPEFSALRNDVDFKRLTTEITRGE